MNHSVGTSNKGLNTLAVLGITIIARAIDCKKKKISDIYKEYVEKALVKYSKNALVQNVDNYHNIHTLKQPNSTDTFWAAHIVTILVNPSFIPAIISKVEKNVNTILTSLKNKLGKNDFVDDKRNTTGKYNLDNVEATSDFAKTEILLKQMRRSFLEM
ncbi:18677_t:CDS:2 [Gigaspora margarita]|uniref:18677_t:CDS:1 n=1 Tax=Gigaspora margarita TaxID=4874 RepID=A0ABN7V8C1_GIGMA|nr:18677_t:CDS:2 [Gigaspora margarita]